MKKKNHSDKPLRSFFFFLIADITVYVAQTSLITTAWNESVKRFVLDGSNTLAQGRSVNETNSLQSHREIDTITALNPNGYFVSTKKKKKKKKKKGGGSGGKKKYWIIN